MRRWQDVLGSLPSWWWPWWALAGLAVVGLMGVAFFIGWLAGLAAVVPAVHQLNQEIAAVKAQRPLTVVRVNWGAAAGGFGLGALVVWRILRRRDPAPRAEGQDGPVPQRSGAWAAWLALGLAALTVAAAVGWPAWSGAVLWWQRSGVGLHALF
ncbi:MAG: hypothetical protein K6U14_04570 [Firmicutes bacterium]|nr:hypothetical protein [Alicyclobacillaceae bacterium]MCL6496896.1 hypothetical protein [Bacillota bacterium]